MPKWSLTNKGNVIQCKWNCKANHEHYIGTYERAVKYFGVDSNEIKSYGKLINLVIYHQTSDRTIRKLSNELYDILISAQSEHKYWAPVEKRCENAIETLDTARKMGLIMDDLLIERFSKSDKNSDKQRLYMFKRWINAL